ALEGICSISCHLHVEDFICTSISVLALQQYLDKLLTGMLNSSAMSIRLFYPQMQTTLHTEITSIASPWVV
ncbi:hypothetical protein L9F63_012302, partial [Diploptera punctata]